jgi:hypothetical protein
MSRRLLLPALAATGAVIVAAWFFVGTRQTADLASANAVVNAGDHLSAADTRHARSLLHSAAFLNPDRTINLDRSRIALKTGHRRLAYRLATSVTHAEPMSVLAWEYVFQAAPNQAARDVAARRVNHLVPPRVTTR